MIKSEMPQVIDIRNIPDTGKVFDLKATPEQLKAIANRLKLVDLKSLTAHVEVKGQTRIKVRGTFEARVTYQCVVTLEPFEESIINSFNTVFEKSSRQETELDLDMEAEDIEPLESDYLDIGEYIIQQLSLSLDLFPKKNKGLVFSYEEGKEEDDAYHPFDKLKILKN